MEQKTKTPLPPEVEELLDELLLDYIEWLHAEEVERVSFVPQSVPQEATV